MHLLKNSGHSSHVSKLHLTDMFEILQSWRSVSLFFLSKLLHERVKSNLGIACQTTFNFWIIFYLKKHSNETSFVDPTFSNKKEKYETI